MVTLNDSVPSEHEPKRAHRRTELTSRRLRHTAAADERLCATELKRNRGVASALDIVMAPIMATGRDG